MSKKERDLEEEILDNIREDRIHISELVASAKQNLQQTSADDQIHTNFGEVLSKYLTVAAKNNEQFIEILKMRQKSNNKKKSDQKEEERITAKDIDSAYEEIVDDVEK